MLLTQMYSRPSRFTIINKFEFKKIFYSTTKSIASLIEQSPSSTLHFTSAFPSNADLDYDFTSQY